ncbi:MAG: MotA/TolQ/ExbB proton channel family protein [Deltaproteobacteria bacterium]|nr:MotA/TolQ/ExbB proton channel family protein [Deltaproteobacteria bacterium]
MSFDLVKIWHDMDWMARGVVFALLTLALGAAVVFVERLIAFARSRRESRAFAAEAVRLMDDGDHDGAAKRTKAYPHSHLAQLLGPTLGIYLEHEEDPAGRGLGAIELTRRELLRRQEEVGADVRRGFGVLATVGSIAPFVGLLGTVVGIIAAFTKISATGSGGLGSVAGGISEALVVTALGLVVAIPAVLAFNFLNARADSITLGLQSSAGQFLDHLEHRHTSRLPVRQVTAEKKEHGHGRALDVPAAS